MVKIRVWDLPTRLFHWLLVAAVVALVVTGNLGGSWMTWHMRLGYAVFALLLFRVVWGFLGGRWSRFAHFVPTPRQLLVYLRDGERTHRVGHNPLGALSVLALLSVLFAQVGTGLFSDDEIAFTGPLTTLVSSDTVSLASWYHADVGKLLLLGLVALHVSAIAYHRLFKKQPLVRAMVTGDQEVPPPAPPVSPDGGTDWLLALCVLGASALVVYAVVGLGNV
jgi:cytochrome b